MLVVLLVVLLFLLRVLVPRVFKADILTFWFSVVGPFLVEVPKG